MTRRSERAGDTSGQTAASLLDAGAPVQQIRGFIRNAIAPSSERLSEALDNWLRVQQPKNLAEKKELADFVNWLTGSSDCTLTVGGKACYLAAVGGYGVPTGRFLITPIGGRKPWMTRVEVADIPKLTLVNSEMPHAPDQAPDADLTPSTWSGRENARRNPRSSSHRR